MRLVEQTKTGAVVSCTVTVKLQMLLLPLKSATKQVTVVVPIGNTLPVAGMQTAVTFVSHASVALAR